MVINKKASGPIGFIFLYMVFVILWFVWLGGYLAVVGQSVVNNNGMTGVEAFFFSNLNLVILIGTTLEMMGYLYFGATQ